MWNYVSLLTSIPFIWSGISILEAWQSWVNNTIFHSFVSLLVSLFGVHGFLRNNSIFEDVIIPPRVYAGNCLGIFKCFPRSAPNKPPWNIPIVDIGVCKLMRVSFDALDAIENWRIDIHQLAWIFWDTYTMNLVMSKKEEM